MRIDCEDASVQGCKEDGVRICVVGLQAKGRAKRARSRKKCGRILPARTEESAGRSERGNALRLSLTENYYYTHLRSSRISLGVQYQQR